MTTTNEELVAEYATLKAQADRDQKRLKELRTQILAVLPHGGEAGEHEVKISRPKTIDWERVEEAFPVSAYPQLWTALDREAVKQQVSPGVLAPFTIEGAPRMTIK